MCKNLQTLVEPLTLRNGAVIPSRIAMSPMVVEGSSKDGFVSQQDIDYFQTRSNVAGLIITGAAVVNENGRGFNYQLSVSDDKYIHGLAKLAESIKKNNSKAVLQIYHCGREAVIAYERLGEVIAPSAIKFPFLSYVPRELTSKEIKEIINDFGRATQRAITAGFDGIEIHGANHYLIQQFFSAYSNHRTDKWGGSLNNRMNFPLAIVEEVQKVVKKFAKADFIVGYRFSPQEIHGENVGYTIDESLQLIEEVIKRKVDYVHVSIFTNYNSHPQGSTESFGQLVRKQVNGRAAVIIISNIFSAIDAANALDHGDIVAIGREALIEPEFALKIKENRIDEIASAISKESFSRLALPDRLTEWYLSENNSLPPLPGVDSLR
ncbi:NADH-dependent flavin oxidoreductase [Sodalis sp. dw_96]|uniref:NADH-dependent flavin oxidoreductase n=1 Tax=Sodalis sp. dw_96 TaxID=2719794 RepID=UPI001BD22810|nr:NADH-dependent flavin oxidoreductase [Sodalis sp. dw_96]